MNTCETCAYAIERLIGRSLVFLCERDRSPVRVLRWWRRDCYLREPGAEG